MGKKCLAKRIIALICLLIAFSFGLFVYAKTFTNNDGYKVGFYSPYTDELPVINDVKIEKYDYQKEIQNLKEYYQNDDIVGKLIIDGTDIDEPILQGKDNSYYLNHNAYGNYQAEGSVYEDYRTKIGDKKVLIFGHSSPGWDVPFNELEKYYDKSFYDNHKEIKVVTENGITVYEIFSVHVETSDFTYMNIHIDTDTYNSYLKKYQDRSFYKTTATVNDNDQILLLQTCSNKSEYQGYNKKFLLVIAKKIREVK